MADQAERTQQKSSNEYSGSQAPEVRKDAEERRQNYSDMRLIPGGARGSAVDVGMTGLHEDTVPGLDEQERLADYGVSADAPHPTVLE